ncbi:hypothetical protein C1H46_044315 [Malus baccata]|uniref:Uncharacterized protein n=1 Tax=Malus baccata TaxID=106549 RepID=A0A540K7G3_MALBA|nr:hypothetical protein C1H46_044315 [Malus baccata]
MAVVTASPERIEAPPQNPIKEPSPSSTPSRLSTADAPSEAEGSSSPLFSCLADTPDCSETCNSSPTADQSAASLKSEEYRQLFRLPPDEVQSISRSNSGHWTDLSFESKLILEKIGDWRKSKKKSNIFEAVLGEENLNL